MFDTDPALTPASSNHDRPVGWWAGIGGLLGIGLLYTVAFLGVALVRARAVPGQLASAIGLVSGLAVLAAAGWVLRADYTGRQILVVLAWTALGIGATGVLAVVLLVEQQYVGLTVRDGGLLVLQLTSFGGLGGLFTGFYHRRQLQQTRRLEASLDRFRALLTAAPAAIVALDHDGRVAVWNPGAEALFGWEQDEVLGEAYPLVPDAHEDEFRELSRLVAEGELVDGVDTKRQHKDGTLIDVRIWSAPLHGRDGTVQGTIGIIVDVTDERRREEQLRVLSRVLRHDLRNGICVINGRAEYLQNELRALETTLDDAPPPARLDQVARTRAAGGDLSLRENDPRGSVVTLSLPQASARSRGEGASHPA